MDRRLRLLTAALIGSLGLNLFLGGWLLRWQLGPHGRERAADGRARFAPDRREDRGHRLLSEDERQSLRLRRQQVRAARAAVAELLASEPVDVAALQLALQAVRQKTDADQAAVHKLIVEKAHAFDADERRRLLRLIDPGRPGRQGRDDTKP